MEFLNNHFNPLLSAFRSGFGCHTALLRRAAFNFSGKTDWSIDLLIKTLMGFVITGCANLMILYIVLFPQHINILLSKLTNDPPQERPPIF
jgi:hypothetical protein